MNRRRLVGIALVLVALLVALWAYTRANQAENETKAEQQSGDFEDDGLVSASTTLLPGRYAVLSARSGGRVQNVRVEAGQVVAAGDVLVELADADLRAVVAQADAQLAGCQAELARLKAGARPQQIAQAQAGLAAAQAGLATVKAGARPEQIAQARAAVDAAAARLAQVRLGTRPEQVAIAEAQVRQAETTLARAQDTYDRMRWVGGETEREMMYQRDAAGAALAVAKAQLGALKAPAQPEEISAAESQVAQAQAQLDLAKAGATAEEVAAAQALVAEAQAQLDLARAGATAEEIAAAQARVDAAKAAADQARAVLAEASVRAPFAGVITGVSARAGETAAPAQPLVTLADLATLRLETDDLSESRIVLVATGQPVTVTFEALPEHTFTGRVTHIAPMSSLKQGGTNYTVTIVLDRLDTALRWGMTGQVEIDTRGQPK